MITRKSEFQRVRAAFQRDTKTAAPSRKALRWQAHKERTWRDLLVSARKLLAERGYHDTSAADIALARE